VQGGSQGDLLRRVIDQLIAELPYARSAEVTGADSTFGDDIAMSGLLGAEDETLVRDLRTALATIATTLNAEGKDPPAGSMQAAVDGAEMVMRGALMTGEGNRLARLMPSLVFLVALPIVEQDRALALSLRTSELIAEQTEARDD
jgi:hypothetical protein